VLHILRHGIVSGGKFRAANPRQGMNGLHSLAAISACQRWVIVSMYDLSSPMYHYILGLDNPTPYMCRTWSILSASLLDSAMGFLLLLSRTCSLFMSKELVCSCYSLFLGFVLSSQRTGVCWLVLPLLYDAK
jgi:hypothetical protein